MVKLIRLEESDSGTEGILSFGDFFCFTLELPWKENKKNVSCIPPGKYYCELINSSRFGRVYHVKDVSDRTNILIHAGNFAGDVSKGLKSDVEGCILLGDDFGILNGQNAISNSKKTLNKFMSEIKNKRFKLEIIDWI